MAARPAETTKARRRRVAFVLLSVLLYVAGVASLYFYPTHLARQTYVSENALLVNGAATSNAWAGINDYVTKAFRLDDPKSFVNASTVFGALGLETYTQVVYLNRTHSLINTYAYMRALKTAGSEAVVLSASSSNYGYPLLAAFAKVLRDSQWLSRDVALLVADGAAPNEAINAWLKSYHELSEPSESFKRSGVLQAALHLDLRSVDFADLQGLLTGESGRLPNLDLFNTLARSAAQERVHVRLPTLRFLNQLADQPQLHTLLSMIFQLASGVPNGPHAAYLRYHIPALTIRSGANTGKGLGVALQRTGRVLEMVVRSVMSLVESFHQSFYYYLLLSEWHYVSIGTYMISLGLTLAPLILTLLYLFYFGQPSGLAHAVLTSIAAHAAAVAAYVAAPLALAHNDRVLPPPFDQHAVRALLWLLASYQLAWLVSRLPASLPLAPANVNAMRIVYILPLALFLGVASLVNFSFTLVAAVVLVPFACLFAALRSFPVNLALWCVWSLPALAYAVAAATGVPFDNLVETAYAQHAQHGALAFPVATLLLLPLHILALRTALAK